MSGGQSSDGVMGWAEAGKDLAGDALRRVKKEASVVQPSVEAFEENLRGFVSADGSVVEIKTCHVK